MPRPPNPRPFKKTVTRYVDAGGKRCKPGDPGAEKVTTKTATYYANIPGIGVVSLETDNEAVAWKVLRDKLKAAHELELGIRDEYQDHARTELDAHVDEWAKVLRAKGTSDMQIELASNRLKRLAQLARWKRLPQIDHDSALKALAKVQAPENEGGLGKSAATRNHYLGHLKAFVAWAVDGDRMKKNTVRQIQPVNPEADRRHLRRVPTAEEIAELCAYLDDKRTPARKKLSARERRLGYLLCMATGFRAGELRSLAKESFNLEASVVTVAAGYSKRRRADTQHLPAWMVEELKAWFAEGGNWKWSRLNRNGPGRILKADLAACRRAWIEKAPTEEEKLARQKSDFLRERVQTAAGPRYWDYHSFRHAYNSAMANRPGMDLKTLLSLTRLSSAELALKTYAHSEEQRIKRAVEDIPKPGEQRSE